MMMKKLYGITTFLLEMLSIFFGKMPIFRGSDHNLPKCFQRNKTKDENSENQRKKTKFL